MPHMGSRADPISCDEDDESDSDNTISPYQSEHDGASYFDTPIDAQLRWPTPLSTNNRRVLHSYEHLGIELRPSMTVELKDGDFLMINAILYPDRITGHSFLEGQIFRRTRQLEGLLEKKKNEVVWIQKYNPNTNGDAFRQSLQRVSVSKIIQIRELVLTNRPFPLGSYRDRRHTSPALSDNEILETYQLTCRWKYLLHSNKEGRLLALGEDETFDGQRSSPSLLKSIYRGSSIEGGSCANWLPGENDFDAVERDRANNPGYIYGTSRRYTFGDSFCGAGGVSRGAKAAGLRVNWGFDSNKAAIDSYRANFFETSSWCCSADTFATAIPDNVKVDILHLSPPCQPFSPAHVRPGQNDDANEAAFFAAEPILKKVKPRIVMVEETFGLLHTNRMQWFNAMIHIFTRSGFSVRWRIFNLLDFGLPGRRQRLFIFASCPGEPLPEFPLPTHCPPSALSAKPHLHPYRTINDAIGSIPATISAHNDSRPCDEAPYDGNIPLPNTLCCGSNVGKHPSSRKIHPSGKRIFTSRELACLSYFPLEHEFGKHSKTELRKQIGNAVGPGIAKVFLEAIIKSLRRTDGL